MSKTSIDTARARAEFFGLRHFPFQSSGPGGELFLTTSRAAVRDFLASRAAKAGVALLSGDAGTGKTSLVRAYLRENAPKSAIAMITLPGDGAMNLLREACKRFCSSLPETGDAQELIDHLRQTLQLGKKRSAALLVVDQVERLTEDSAPSLAALSELASGERIPLSILLIGSPVHGPAAVPLETTGIAAHLAARQIVAPFSAEETAQYVASLIKGAGGSIDDIFDSSAVKAIHQGSRGVPATVNAICQTAALLAHRAGDRRIRVPHVEAAAAKRALVEKSAHKDDVFLSRERDAGTKRSRADLAWSSVSLADVSSDGCGIAFAAVSPDASYDSTSMHETASGDDADLRLRRLERRLDEALERLTHGASSPSPKRRLSEIGSVLDETQERAAALDARAQQHAALLDALDERVHRAEAVTARSIDVESRLRTLAAEVANHAEALQERMAGLLEVADSAQDDEESLRRVATSAQAIGSQAHQRLLDSTTKWQGAIERSADQAVSLIAEKSAGLQSQIESATLLINERGPKFLLAADHQLQDAWREIAAKLAPIQAQVQGAIAESTAILENTRTHLESEHERSHRRLDQMLSQTADSLIAVSTACEQADTACTELNKAREALATSAARSGEIASQLDQQRAESKSAAAELSRITASARHAAEVLTVQHAAVDEKSQQLASHEAAARSLLNQVADATVSAADASKRLEQQRHEAHAEAVHLAQKHTELVIGIESLISSANAQYGRLENQVSDSASTSAELQRTVITTMEARGQVQAALEESLRQTTRLNELNERGALLADRSASISATLAAAEGISHRLEKIVACSENSGAELIAVVQNAQSRIESLSGLHDKADELTEVHRNLVADGEVLLNRVALRLESLKEIEQRIAASDSAADGVQGRLAEIHEHLAEAMSAVGEPRRILTEAEVQSVQLERVCGAARKVKAAVSQAALAADERARELTTAEQAAARRQSQLQYDLATAAQTLAQWVAEADRVQSRLEATIDRCPPIRSTHAMGSLQSLAQAARELAPRGAQAARELAPLAAQGANGRRPPEPIRGASPTASPARPTREEEIAQLLAEARKARKDVEAPPRLAKDNVPPAQSNGLEDALSSI